MRGSVSFFFFSFFSSSLELLSRPVENKENIPAANRQRGGGELIFQGNGSFSFSKKNVPAAGSLAFGPLRIAAECERECKCKCRERGREVEVRGGLGWGRGRGKRER